MRRAGAVVTVCLAAFVAAGLSRSESLRPLPLHASEKTEALYGVLVNQAFPPRLAEIDPATMRALPGRSRRLGTSVASVGAWSFAPDRGAVALAVQTPGEPSLARIRLVSLPSLRPIVTTIPLGEGWTWELAWVSPARLIGLAGDWKRRFFVADLAQRRIVSSSTIEGQVLQVERAGDRLVVLLAPELGIGPTRLAVAAADGSVRVVTLDRVLGGYTQSDDPERVPPEHRVPGLAVDVQGGRAFVFPAESTVAEIDLDTLAVDHHALARPVSVLGRLGAWLEPRAEAKILTGPSRDARWLGDGLIALTGVDYDGGVDAAGQHYLHVNPAGLNIVDVRRWTIRKVDPGASWARPADELLLVAGQTMGFAGYGPDLTKRFHLFRGQPAWVEGAYDGLAYVRVGETSTTTVVDLRAGTAVAERFGQPPVLLVEK